LVENLDFRAMLAFFAQGELDRFPRYAGLMVVGGTTICSGYRDRF